jgi:putative two-component system response regulator
MIVDDIAANIDILLETLRNDYTVMVATKGENALKLAQREPQPDIILLDIMMPQMDGFEVCRRLKSNEYTKQIPVIFVTTLTQSDEEAKGLGLGAVDYITKPIHPQLVKARISNHLELKRHKDHLEELVNERTKELKLAKEATIEAMGIVAENRDPETGGHIQRTKNYMKVLSSELAVNPKYQDILTDDTIELYYSSAPLHDIGKVAISDKILLKPTQLNEDEYNKMKEHTIIGEATIAMVQNKVGKNEFLETAKLMAVSHHEKYDGSGYPRGLKGDDIPLCGRLMAIADVYDALITRRTYKEPITHSKVVEMIKSESGTHFDPDIVEAFLNSSEQFRQIAIEFAQSDEELRSINH